MAWARFDDRFHGNPKDLGGWHTCPEAIGLFVMCVTYCSQHETDGIVPDWFLSTLEGSKAKRNRLASALLNAGMFSEHETGYVINDYLEYNPSRDELTAERAWRKRKRELHNDPELVAAVRTRDGNRCRYCGSLVNWKDRRGKSGGTYDHVVPRGPNSLGNVVVACRSCNSQKNARTPEEAGMVLLDPRQLEARSDLDPSQIKPGSDPATRPDPSRPDPVVDNQTFQEVLKGGVG